MEAPSRVERLPEPFAATTGAATTAAAVASAIGTVSGRPPSRVNGWAVSLVTPAAIAPGVDWLLSFRNFYSASIRVDLVLGDGQTATLLESLPLMRHLHCEDDAQNWHVVKLELESLAGPELTGRTLMGLRVYCRQPSPAWAKWELHSIKLYQYKKTSADTSTAAMKGIAMADSGCAGTHTLAARSSRSAAELDKMAEEAATNQSRSIPSAAVTFEDRKSSPAHSHPSSVDDQAVRCLDLVLRLRHLLAVPAASPF